MSAERRSSSGSAAGAGEGHFHWEVKRGSGAVPASALPTPAHPPARVLLSALLQVNGGATHLAPLQDACLCDNGGGTLMAMADTDGSFSLQRVEDGQCLLWTSTTTAPFAPSGVRRRSEHGASAG